MDKKHDEDKKRDEVLKKRVRDLILKDARTEMNQLQRITNHAADRYLAGGEAAELVEAMKIVALRRGHMHDTLASLGGLSFGFPALPDTGDEVDE